MDVAIVGAGPAGARAAYVLASRGASVTIFDPSHPREKPCGGGVTGRALDLVRGAIDVDAIARTRIRAARFTSSPRPRREARAGGQPAVVVPFDAGALVVASRASFDAALLDAAVRVGARLERVRVTDVAVRPDGVDLQTTAGRRRAAFLVGADGANSLVRRRVAAAFRRDQLSVATGFFAHGLTSDEIQIEFVSDPPGYLWSFPRPDHLAVGICAQADNMVTATELRARVSRWIAASGTGLRRRADGETITGRLESYAWPIPSLRARDFDLLTLASSRWALAGDAAGLVDPITREGIYFAIASGEWVAEALSSRDAAPNYAARVRDEAAAELARAARLKPGFFRASFIGVMVRALDQSGAIRSVMADLVAGRQPYATLKWRLIKTFEVGAAWRALIT